MYDELYKECFAFFSTAVSLEEAKSFIKSPQRGKKITSVDHQKILSMIDIILNSADFTDPHFDIFVESMLRLRSLYERFDPTDFHPVFVASFFNDDDQDMWDWIIDLKQKIDMRKGDGRRYIPTEDDIKGMRYVVYDLNTVLSQEKIFSTPDVWEKTLSLEGESSDE